MRINEHNEKVIAMKMSHREALKVLGLKGSCSFDEAKRVYRVKSQYYHPDRNPAGLEMMKLINGAWSALSDYEFGREDLEEERVGECLSDELNNALNAVVGLGLTIEICGSWIWVSGDTKPHKDVLKESGYRWAPKKLMWSFCGGERTSSRGKFSMDDIRNRHGSSVVRNRDNVRLSA